MIMATLLKATGKSFPVKRDYSITGSKIILTTRDDRMYIDIMSVLGWLRQITGLHIHDGRQAGDEKTWKYILREISPISSSFVRLIDVLMWGARKTEEKAPEPIRSRIRYEPTSGSGQPIGDPPSRIFTTPLGLLW
jgi:hypothetical protein